MTPQGPGPSGGHEHHQCLAATRLTFDVQRCLELPSLRKDLLVHLLGSNQCPFPLGNDLSCVMTPLGGAYERGRRTTERMKVGQRNG